MKKSDLKLLLRKPGAVRTPEAELEIRNVRLLAPDGAYQNCATADPFQAMKSRPDMFKAYVDFEICHSFPQVTGPTMSGAFLGYHPAVLAENHPSLLHQWMNLRHQTKANDAAGTARDRIVGCVVATSFPSMPAQGWSIPQNASEAPCITARAVLFKLAEGVNRVLGDHQASRQPWSVSIETDAALDQIGIYLPSTREIWSLEDSPDDLLDAVTVDDQTGSLKIGPARGEQPAFAYGQKNGKLHFRGVGMTPNPAERTARITSIQAEGYWSIAAEGGEEKLLEGRSCSWDRGAHRGVIREVKKEGKLTHPGLGWALTASESDPALKIYLPRGVVVMKSLSQVEVVA